MEYGHRINHFYHGPSVLGSVPIKNCRSCSRPYFNEVTKEKLMGNFSRGQAHRVKLITTGGTIAGHVATEKQDKQMVRMAEEFTEQLEPTISYLNRHHQIDIDIAPP